MFALGWVYVWGAVVVAFGIVAVCDTEGERHPIGTALAVMFWPVLAPLVVVIFARDAWAVIRGAA